MKPKIFKKKHKSFPKPNLKIMESAMVEAVEDVGYRNPLINYCRKKFRIKV